MSQTAGKDDNEGNDAKEQTVKAHQEEPTPIEFEVSVPKRDHDEYMTPIKEEKLQIIPPLGPVQLQPPPFIKTHKDHRLFMTNSKPRGLVCPSCLL